MTGRSTMLPIAMVVVIVLLVLIAITSGRSNAPDVAGDDTYPHYVCTFNEYCEGDVCVREDRSFVVYMEHANGQPRLELPRVNPVATLTSSTAQRVFETNSGELSGSLTLYPERTFDWVGLSGTADAPIEHFATGRCDRLRTP